MKWSANEIVRANLCALLIAVALVNLIVEFGWVGVGIALLAVLFIAGGMAS